MQETLPSTLWAGLKQQSKQALFVWRSMRALLLLPDLLVTLRTTCPLVPGRGSAGRQQPMTPKDGRPFIFLRDVMRLVKRWKSLSKGPGSLHNQFLQSFVHSIESTGFPKTDAVNVPPQAKWEFLLLCLVMRGCLCQVSAPLKSPDEWWLFLGGSVPRGQLDGLIRYLPISLCTFVPSQWTCFF